MLKDPLLRFSISMNSSMLIDCLEALLSKLAIREVGSTS